MTPLKDIKVLDLSRVLAGPWATQLLADLGAEVIKVERPGAGDDTRTWGPPYAQPTGKDAEQESAYFLAANRGKIGIAVDFVDEAGRDIVRRLAASSDVLIENFRVGQLAKYGLDYAALREINPGLIYCSISGFGQTGPYAKRAGYDFIIQGMGGLMSITGHADGEPGAGPLKAGVALTDIMTGLYASNAILAALHHRANTGQGQYIDLALLDVQVATLANQALNFLVSDASPTRRGNAHPSIVPYETFGAADAPINIAVGNDAQFARLCQILDLAVLADDSRFKTNEGRVRHRKTLIPILQAAFDRRPAAAWLVDLAAAGVPAGPINSMREVFEDPQIQHRQIQIDLPHDTLGSAPGIGCPIRFSETPVAYTRSAPTLGQDTAWVLRERLNLSQAQIDALAASGVVSDASSPPRRRAAAGSQN